MANVYLAYGSEDGLLGVYRSKKRAIKQAEDYVKAELRGDLVECEYRDVGIVTKISHVYAAATAQVETREVL